MQTHNTEYHEIMRYEVKIAAYFFYSLCSRVFRGIPQQEVRSFYRNVFLFFSQVVSEETHISFK